MLLRISVFPLLSSHLLSSLSPHDDLLCLAEVREAEAIEAAPVLLLTRWVAVHAGPMVHGAYHCCCTHRSTAAILAGSVLGRCGLRLLTAPCSARTLTPLANLSSSSLPGGGRTGWGGFRVSSRCALAEWCRAVLTVLNALQIYDTMRVSSLAWTASVVSAHPG